MQKNNPRFRLGWRDTGRVLLPYLKRNFMDQISSIWFIVAYLALFQILVLHLPIAYAGMIAGGLIVVALGLTFFMEGLRLGLMPLGETIGSILPRSSGLPLILLFAFLLGAGATFAEPAIAVLKAAGKGVQADSAPLLYSLLNDFSGQLVMAVGAGVGVAVVLGVLRFFFAWHLKWLAVPLVSLLLGLSYFFSRQPVLADVLGLAWDCGAVTTGPVTVPLVLALGIGVCRVVASGSGGGGHSGFGIVTLASLFPILAVMLLALAHYHAEDYYGAPAFKGALISSAATDDTPAPVFRDAEPIPAAEFQEFKQDSTLRAGYRVRFDGSEPRLVDGRIMLTDPDVIIEKIPDRSLHLVTGDSWDSSRSLGTDVKTALTDAVRAIVPLCLFMVVVLRMILNQKRARGSDVGIGIVFALGGMFLFGLGITLGLTPLGSQLGSNIPISFAPVVPWGGTYLEPALFSGHAGKLLAIGFAFFLGYGATLAEPALNALGDTVEKITVGAFQKKLLMHSVATGVGLGIAAGIFKMAYGLALLDLLLPAYAVVIVLTLKAPNSFVNFSWDSAGVTTGPITVPLVLAMGLGVGANVKGVNDGFGILALASVGPIMTVLTVGLITQAKQSKKAVSHEQSEDLLEVLG